MRLIDADKLLDDFQIWPICDDCAQLEDTECELSGMYICKAIQNAPTVDAIPVEWLKRRMEKGLDERFLKGDMEEALIARSCWNVLEVWKREAKA